MCGTEIERNFYPRPPRGGRPGTALQGCERIVISIHALREEGDLWFLALPLYLVDFYPRPPRGGRRQKKSPASVGGVISIHALREEGDRHALTADPVPDYFYPRPPRGGRPLNSAEKNQKTNNFYPRPPRGGRRWQQTLHPAQSRFLSTPSARRATRMGIEWVASYVEFLSTPSARRATPLRMPLGGLITYFYPRPPRGGRRLKRSPTDWMKIFLSTPSARRATFNAVGRDAPLRQISIHALREEGD